MIWSSARKELKSRLSVSFDLSPIAGWPLSRQCEIPWQFAALLRGTRHVKCYSYHARTSTKYLYGHKYEAYDKQF